MFVEIGLDRIYHTFWRYFDDSHHLHVPGSDFKMVVRDYYIYLDRKIGALLDHVEEDTVILIVSDHGGKGMASCFCVNSWLEKEDLLKLSRPPVKVTSFNEVNVDWTRTSAWGWAGYYTRIFLNVKGREEMGIIKPEEYDTVRECLKETIKGIHGPNGEEWDTKVIKPKEVYPEVKGDAPDLMIYFNNLSWRSAGTLSHGTVYLHETDTGPDDAVHDMRGL